MRWLCHFPEHYPDALVCANALLRRFLLESRVGTSGDGAGGEAAAAEAAVEDAKLHAAEVFVNEILPRNLVDVALKHCVGEEEEVGPESVSLALVEDLKAEFVSIERLLHARALHARFLRVVSETPSRHSSTIRVRRSSTAAAPPALSAAEAEAAKKFEMRDALQKKMGACRIILGAAERASEAWEGVLKFEGGWLADGDNDGIGNGGGNAFESETRSAEMNSIRSIFLPTATFHLRDVHDRTAAWLEETTDDLLDRFGDDGRGSIVSLLERHDEGTSSDVFATSQAAPGYWHRKALSLATLVARDEFAVHGAFGVDDMKRFMDLMAESSLKLMRSSQARAAFDS